MEPEENTREFTPEKHVLHTVTPLSKYLAMVLFVLMPFIGGWIGYKYSPEKIAEVEKVIIMEVEAEPEIKKSIQSDVPFSTKISTSNNNRYSLHVFPVSYREIEDCTATDGCFPIIEDYSIKHILLDSKTNRSQIYGPFEKEVDFLFVDLTQTVVLWNEDTVVVKDVLTGAEYTVRLSDLSLIN